MFVDKTQILAESQGTYMFMRERKKRGVCSHLEYKGERVACKIQSCILIFFISVTLTEVVITARSQLT